MRTRFRTVVVGDALLPAGLVVDALRELDPWIDVIGTIDWGPPDEALLDEMALHLEREGPSAEEPPSELDAYLHHTDVLIVHYCPVSAELLKRAPGLKLLGTCRAGTENLEVQAAVRRGITTVHVMGRTTEAVSDFTIGLLICEARNIARAHRRLMDGVWQKTFLNTAFTPELETRTIGIVGFGEIGRAVARKLRGFSVRVIAHDPFVPDPSIEKVGVGPVDLDELLQTSDFVTLHARPTPGQPPLIGARELGLMKPTAVLINTARAALIDNGALYEALRERRIGGAALDVHDREPLGKDHPFLGLDNVTLTPHLASSTRDCIVKSPRLLAGDLKRIFQGETPGTVLNPESLEGLRKALGGQAASH